MKVKGPMFSLEASGTIGGVITAAKWKGRPYFRTTATPSNPRTGGQVSTRAMFKFLAQAWAGLPDLDKATWMDLAAATNVTPFNAYQQYDMRRWTQSQAPSSAYPAAENDTVNAVVITSATPGVKQVTLLLTETSGDQPAWGVLIYRSTTTGFTPTNTDLVGVAPGNNAAGTITFVDTPVAAGTYYYRAKAFDMLADFGTLTAQTSAVVT